MASGPATDTSPKQDVLPVVRAQVRDILRRTPAFQELPPDKRQALAHDMVKVARYLSSGETGRPLTLAGEGPNADFEAEAARQGGQAYTDVIRQVDFPKFVAGLIDGVFTAIVDASIKQMEAYAELLKNVVKSVDQFMKDNVSENQARDYLVGKYPDYLELDLEGEQPRVKPKEDHDDSNLPDFFRDLGLSMPVESLDEEVVEEQLVPATRMFLAGERQRMLATMVLMGINRLIVTNGNISASVLFRLDTTDSLKRRKRNATESETERNWQYKRRNSWWSWFRPYSYEEQGSAKFKVTTNQEEDSEDKVKMHVDLKGNVNVNFRSETFPLEKMTDFLQISEIRRKAPSQLSDGRGAPDEGTQAPASGAPQG
jgi:hypothetical protein